MVSILHSESATPFETSFTVRGNAAERIGLPARPKVLQELSKLTQGTSIALHELETLQSTLGQTPVQPMVQQRWLGWAHPATLFLLAGMMSVFWYLRKRVGLL
jgi:hypothetical protein